MPGFSRRASKDIEELPAPLQEKARALASRLDEEPGLGKKLKGKLEGVRSARLGRSHRLLYTVRDGNVIVVTVTPRRDAYR